MDDKPVIHAIVAWPLPWGEFILSQQDTVTLDEAASYARMGWAVIIDPADEAEFVRWQQIQRSLSSPRRRGWREWGHD